MDEGKTIQVRMKLKQVDRVDAVAAQFSWNRSELVRQAINAFLVNVEGSLDTMKELIDTAQVNENAARAGDV